MAGWIIPLIVLLLSVPVGYLIAWLCKEELVPGRKWFRIIMGASVIIGIWFYLVNLLYITLTMVFILVCVTISLLKSFDKKWKKYRL